MDPAAPPEPSAIDRQLGSLGDDAAKGSEARAEALAEMDALLHRMRTDPALVALLARADSEPLDAAARSNLREIRRDWASSNALPQALVEAKSLATSRCEHAWRTQRPANDWKSFVVNLREVVRLAREEAKFLAEASGLSLYDALMDQYEPGTTSAEAATLFGDLQKWLPPLVRAVREKQASEPVITSVGPFPKASQRALSLDVMALLGFDFEAGRLDESAHPFSGGVPEDTRLTTRYREDDFAQEPDGHDPRNRSRALRAEPAARDARPARRPCPLDGDPRKPEPVVRDAAGPQRRLHRPDGAAARGAPRRPAGVRKRQPAAPAHARQAWLHPRRRR